MKTTNKPVNIQHNAIIGKVWSCPSFIHLNHINLFAWISGTNAKKPAGISLPCQLVWPGFQHDSFLPRKQRRNTGDKKIMKEKYGSKQAHLEISGNRHPCACSTTERKKGKYPNSLGFYLSSEIHLSKPHFCTVSPFFEKIVIIRIITCQCQP